MRGYAAVITGILTSIISVFALWNTTKMDAIEIIVAAFMVYLFAVLGFMIATERKKVN